MEPIAVVAGSILFALGVAGALALGIASARLEHAREHDAGTTGAHS